MSNKVINKVPEAYDRLLKEVDEWVHDGVDLIEQEIKAKLDAPKSGKKYGSHQASAPGEAPANQSRELTDSIDRDKKFLRDKAGSRLLKAIYLEKGTEDDEGKQLIAPRPLWEATLREQKPILDARLKLATARASR